MSDAPRPSPPAAPGAAMVAASDAGIARAAAVLKAGGLVGLPTETVYGLAGDATRGDTVARIFAAKARPALNPLIVHVADIAAAAALGQIQGDAATLAAALWPGPLSLVVARLPDCPVHELATAGLATVALRVPAHPVAQAVLRAAGVPLAAPSANPSGRLSATDPRHVADALGAAVDLVLAAGRTPIGLESTVIDCTGRRPALLRPGAVTPEDLDRVLGPGTWDRPAGDDLQGSGRPRSPGLLLRHYAPAKPLRIAARDGFHAGEALLRFGPNPFIGSGAKVQYQLSAEGDLAEAAANLFALLHQADAEPTTRAIAVAPIPEIGLGLAINDRLRRAAAAQVPPSTAAVATDTA